MNCQKCIEKIANIAKITNSTRIANCSKRKLLKKVISPKLISFNLDENARPFEFFKFIPFESDT